MIEKKLIRILGELIDILEKKNKEIDELKGIPSAPEPRTKNDENKRFGYFYNQTIKKADLPTDKNRSEEVLILKDPAPPPI